jgi:hypothetical protein
MKHQVFLFVSLFSFSVYPMVVDTTKMLTPQEVTTNLNAYMAYLDQFSQLIDKKLVEAEVRKIKNRYPQGSSLKNILADISELPCPIIIGNTVVLLENKNEPVKKSY